MPIIKRKVLTTFHLREEQYSVISVYMGALELQKEHFKSWDVPEREEEYQQFKKIQKEAIKIIKEIGAEKVYKSCEFYYFNELEKSITFEWFREIYQK